MLNLVDGLDAPNLVSARKHLFSKRFELTLAKDKHTFQALLKEVYTNIRSDTGIYHYKLEVAPDTVSFAFTLTQISLHRWQQTAVLFALSESKGDSAETCIIGAVYPSSYSTSHAFGFTLLTCMLLAGYVWLLRYGDLSTLIHVITIGFCVFPAIFSWWRLFADRNQLLKRLISDIS